MNKYSKIFAFLREQKAFTAFMTALVVISSVSAVFYAKVSHAANPIDDTYQFEHVTDTLTTAQASFAADHTIKFAPGETTNLSEGGPNPLANGNQALDLTITLKDFVMTQAMVAGDFDLTGAAPLTFKSAAQVASDTVLTFTLPANQSVAPGTILTIVTKNARLINPATGVHHVIIYANATNTTPKRQFKSDTLTATVDNVHMAAVIDPILSFTVSGVPTGTTVTTGVTTNVTTATGTIDFGTIQSGPANAKIAAQKLTIKTNAQEGFTVTARTDGDFQSANGAKINPMNNGTITTDTPAAWAMPTLDLANNITFGQIGMTSACTGDVGGCTSAFTTANTWTGNFVANATNPKTVLSGTAPTDGVGNFGSTMVAYKVEVTDLQPAATDYKTNVIYVATPKF